MPRVSGATRRLVIRPIVSVISVALLLFSSAITLDSQPAPSAAATTAQPTKSTLSLESFAFSNATNGFVVFTRESLSGTTCTDLVGKTTDSGTVIAALVKVVTWNCATGEFTSLLANDGEGDVFLYGPGLYVSHDNGISWSISPQSGTVLNVEALGESVWMVLSACTHTESVAHSPCSVQLRESSNGGRTWKPSAASPPGFNGGVSSGASGRTYLVRLSRSRAYLMLAPPFTSDNHSKSVPLWYTSSAGATWSSRAVPCHLRTWSAVLSVAPNGTLMAVCASEPSVGEQLKSVLESVNGGRTWVLKTDSSIDIGYLGAIDLLSGRHAFLVGGRSSLMVTHDGGEQWHAVTPLIGSSAGGTFQVQFFNDEHGLVLGNNDNDNEKLTLWRTSDGGAHWTTITSRIEG